MQPQTSKDSHLYDMFFANIEHRMACRGNQPILTADIHTGWAARSCGQSLLHFRLSGAYERSTQRFSYWASPSLKLFKCSSPSHMTVVKSDVSTFLVESSQIPMVCTVATHYLNPTVLLHLVLCAFIPNNTV